MNNPMPQTSNLVIRTATAADIDTIAAFNAALATESEGKTLDGNTLRAGLQALFADPGKGCYFLAEQVGRIVGQTMLTYEWSDWRNGVFWWIQSVYVVPEARGTGVFGALYRHIEKSATADPGVCGLRLYVDKDNTSAARVYRQLGMQDAHYDMLEVDFILGNSG